MVQPKTEALEAALRYVREGRWAVDVERGTITGTRYGRLIGHKAPNGYLWATVRLDDGREVNVLAHRIVWAVARGVVDFGQLNHRNGRKSDNRLANLEAVTDSQNKLHAFATGLAPVGAGHHNARFIEADVLEMRRLRAEGMPLREIAERFGTSLSTVSGIAHRKGWAHVASNEDGGWTAATVQLSVARGERGGQSKLTESDVREIRRLHGEGMLQRDIAAQYGVSKQAISHIVRRTTWAHLD